MGHQMNVAGQAIARADGKFPDVSAAAGRKGFKAELDGLRERMRGLGFSTDEIAAEIGRRYRLRPRESYRLAWAGWLNVVGEITMCGTVGTARHASAGGHARHTFCQPGTTVRIPPLADPQGIDVTGRWPLQSFLELGALPSAVPCARLHTRHVLWDWGVSSLIDSTELLVSEIITNAVHISREMDHAAVRLWLLCDRARVVVLAWDPSPLPPVPVTPDTDIENGRGLLLVDAISERWGWYFPDKQPSTDAPDQRGKVVWAVVQLITRTAAKRGRRRQWRH